MSNLMGGYRICVFFSLEGYLFFLQSQTTRCQYNLLTFPLRPFTINCYRSSVWMLNSPGGRLHGNPCWASGASGWLTCCVFLETGKGPYKYKSIYHSRSNLGDKACIAMHAGRRRHNSASTVQDLLLQSNTFTINNVGKLDIKNHCHGKQQEFHIITLNSVSASCAMRGR